MDLAIQLVVSGLLAGAPYALAAWGAAVTLGMGVLNLTLGAFFTLGAYLALAATSRGFPAFCAAAPAAAAALVLGLCIERVFVRPLRPWPLASALVLLGVAVLSEGFFQLVWGAADQSVPLRLPVLQIEHLVVAGSELFVTAGATLAVIGLLALARRTRAGIAFAAVAENSEIAASAGVHVERLRTWAFAAGCAAAAAAGALTSPNSPLSPSMGRAALLFSLAAAAAGGPGLGGLLAASLALGVVTNSSAGYMAPQWGVVVPALVFAGAVAWRRSPLWQRGARA
jgi:branched-chain amino acid transport system permease protein